MFTTSRTKYALIRTENAIYDRAEILHQSESHMTLRFVRKSGPDKADVRTETESIRKGTIIEIRYYEE